MNLIVIISACLTIILALLYKFYSLNIIYPTLMLILTIVLDILSNTIRIRKDRNIKKDIENEVLKK